MSLTGIDLIISKASLYAFNGASQEEILELFSDLLRLMITMDEEERKKIKSIYWKLSFMCSDSLNFVSKDSKARLEAGSKEKPRRKNND